MKITITRDVKAPTRGTSKSAGLDFYVPNDFNKDFYLSASQSIVIPSGIKVEVPKNHALIAFNKSGIALSGLQIGACVIDEDYQGEIHLHLYNTTKHEIKIEPGKKIVQFILLPVVYEPIEIVEEMEMFHIKSERGDGAFGSTNKK